MSLVTVYAPGCWDLLHVGHARFLERASGLGHRLVVGVPTDDVVLQDKGRLPIIPAEQRIEMVRSLRCVYAALMYDTLDFLPHLEMLNPYMVAVGPDWGEEPRHLAVAEWAKKSSQRLMVRLDKTEGVSTSEIVARVLRLRGNGGKS